MAEAAFSEDGKYYSAISPDGRLRIWDTETNTLKQEYTPDLHLTSPPSCVQWITVRTSAVSERKGRRKSSISEQETQCIALGTTSGKILIYSVAKAKVETVLEEKVGLIQDRKISCLDWTRKDGLFSCNKSNYVCHWKLDVDKRKSYNVNTDNKSKISGISAIKIIPHSLDTNATYIITASWQLRVWRLHEDSASVIKCLGHNASQQSILAIAENSDKTWVIEGSRTERLLSFWDVTVTSDVAPVANGEEVSPNKKKRKKSLSTTDVPTTNIPTYNFVLEDAPKMIDVKVQEDGETKLTLAAVTRSGVVHYYVHTLNGASAKPVKPSLTVHVTTAAAAPLPLQAGRLERAALQLGYQQGPALVFETITPDLSSKTQVLIRGETKTKKKRSGSTSEATKVASGPPRGVQYVEPMGGVTRKRAAPGAKLEVPMEARLANLALDPAGRGRGAVAHSLTKLLVQGLHSRDKGILEMVLRQPGGGAAARTAAQLPPEYLPALLDQLAALAAKRTSLCAHVCTWVSAILRSHAALLLATMNAHNADQLTKLLATFTNRRSHLCQLLNLKGRLELTLAQRAARGAPASHDPVIDYQDTSDEEMEVERQSNASDASWDSDKFDSEGEGEGEGGCSGGE